MPAMDETELCSVLLSQVMYRMYALTHNESHAVMARAFDKNRFYEPLKSNHDALGGLHANTHLAQASG